MFDLPDGNMNDICWTCQGIVDHPEFCTTRTYQFEDIILECKYKLADEIDTIYETKYLYPEGDYGAMLEAVYNVIEVSGSIEASNWLISETDGGYIVSCCANHGDKHYSHLEDAINSICVWPDREYHEQVYWKDQK